MLPMDVRRTGTELTFMLFPERSGPDLMWQLPSPILRTNYLGLNQSLVR